MLTRLRHLLLLAVVLLAPTLAQAQYTTVTAQVKDAAGSLYTNCQVSASYVPSPGATTVPTIGGSTFPTTVPVVQCDSSANFSVVLVDNNQVSDGHTVPPSSEWRLNVCSAKGAFPIQYCFNDTLVITGATQNITASLTAVAPLLPISGGGGIVPSTVAGPDYVATSVSPNVAAWEQVNSGSSCGDSSHAVSYSTSTHTFGCQTLTVGAAFPLTSPCTPFATAGAIRLCDSDTIDWRDPTNTTNLPLGVNNSGQLTFAGSVLPGLGLNNTWTGTNTFNGATVLNNAQNCLGAACPVYEEGPGYCNILNFGAVGDGITNDRAAFQAAEDACGFVVVTRNGPNGAGYLISGAMILNANTFFDAGVSMVADTTWKLNDSVGMYSTTSGSQQNSFFQPQIISSASPAIQAGSATFAADDSIHDISITSTTGIALSAPFGADQNGGANVLELLNDNLTSCGNFPAVNMVDVGGLFVEGGVYATGVSACTAGAGVHIFALTSSGNSAGGVADLHFTNTTLDGRNPIGISSAGGSTPVMGRIFMDGVNQAVQSTDDGAMITIDTSVTSFKGLYCRNSFIWQTPASPDDPRAFLVWSAGTTGTLSEVSLDNCASVNGINPGNGDWGFTADQVIVPSGQTINNFVNKPHNSTFAFPVTSAANVGSVPTWQGFNTPTTWSGLYFSGNDLLVPTVNSAHLGSADIPFLNQFIGPAANESFSWNVSGLTGNRTYTAVDASGYIGVVTGSPSNNDCAKITVSGGLITGITSAGVGACSGSSGTTAALSAITAATGTNTIASGDNDQIWQWQQTTNGTSAFTLTETAASAATTSFLFNVHTLSTSTVLPVKFTAGGTANGVDMTTAGLLQAIGSGGINATLYKSGTASGVGSPCGANNFVTALNDASGPTCAQPSFANISGTIALAQTALTTQGDLLYANASPALARLAIGSTGQCLTVAGGLPAWGNSCGLTIVGTPAANSITQWVTSTSVQGIAPTGGGVNPLLVTPGSGSSGDYWAINGSGNTVETTPGVSIDKRTTTSETISCTPGTGDRGALVTFSNSSAIAVTVPQAGTGSCTNNFYFSYRVIGAGAVTFTPTTSTVNGNSTLVALPGQFGSFVSDNTNYTANVGGYASGTTGTITGTALTATCDSGTATIIGAAAGMPVSVSSTTGADVGGAFNVRASVTSSNTVTVYVCGTGTPSSLAYNVRVLP